MSWKVCDDGSPPATSLTVMAGSNVRPPSVERARRRSLAGKRRPSTGVLFCQRTSTSPLGATATCAGACSCGAASPAMSLTRTVAPTSPRSIRARYTSALPGCAPTHATYTVPVRGSTATVGLLAPPAASVSTGPNSGPVRPQPASRRSAAAAVAATRAWTRLRCVIASSSPLNGSTILDPCVERPPQSRRELLAPRLGVARELGVARVEEVGHAAEDPEPLAHRHLGPQVHQVVTGVAVRVLRVHPVTADAHPFEHRLAAAQSRRRPGEPRAADLAGRAVHLVAAVVQPLARLPDLVGVPRHGVRHVHAQRGVQLGADPRLDPGVQRLAGVHRLAAAVRVGERQDVVRLGHAVRRELVVQAPGDTAANPGLDVLDLDGLEPERVLRLPLAEALALRGRPEAVLPRGEDVERIRDRVGRAELRAHAPVAHLRVRRPAVLAGRDDVELVVVVVAEVVIAHARGQ